MKLLYQEHSLKPGIYKIVNTHTNRIYIGQAKEFKARWNGHKHSLLTGKHQNKFLLNDFNKCREQLGHDDFLEFHVLEIMQNSTKEERNKREEEFIAQWFDDGKQCYNLTKRAVCREGSKDRSPEASFQRRSAATKGRKHSEQSKRRMSEVQKATLNPRNSGKKLSEATKNKIRLAHLGKKKSNEHKAKMALIAQRRSSPVVAIQMTTGIEQEFPSIREACRQLNVRSGNISNVLSGRYKQTAGYSFRHKQ